MRSLISILELSVEELDQLITTAKDIIAHPENYWDRCAHKKLATLFFEPSTRTRLSFESVIIGGFEARSILVGMQNVELKRPIVYDLMLDMMNQCDIDLVRVDIVRKSGEAYFSKLVIMNGDEELQLDSRTSDSVALAVRYNAPIYVEEMILEEVKDRVQIRHTDDAPVHMLFDEELEEALQRAIASENYERAQEIKNRINKI